MNPERLDSFMALYVPNLERAVRERPDEYAYPVSEVPAVAARMREAFIWGTFNHKSRTIGWTCKALRIKHTRKALVAYFGGQ